MNSATNKLIMPGSWSGQFINPGSVTYGNIDQPGPPVYVAEFSYLMVPVLLWTPTEKETGGVLMLAPVASQKPLESPGFIHSQGDGSMKMVSLNTNRSQFTDIVTHTRLRQIMRFDFQVAESQSAWRIVSWSMTAEFRDPSAPKQTS